MFSHFEYKMIYLRAQIMKSKSYSIKDKTYSFTLGTYFQMPFKIIAGVMVLGGAGSLSQGFGITPIVFMVLGLFILVAKTGIQVNFTIGNYREGLSLFGTQFGSWSALPVIDYVSIFPTQLGQNVHGFVPSNHKKLMYKDVRINLIYNRAKRMHVFTSDHRELYYEVAMLFGEHLNVGVYDCTGAENEWIKPDNR